MRNRLKIDTCQWGRHITFFFFFFQVFFQGFWIHYLVELRNSNSILTYYNCELFSYLGFISSKLIHLNNMKKCRFWKCIFSTGYYIELGHICSVKQRHHRHNGVLYVATWYPLLILLKSVKQQKQQEFQGRSFLLTCVQTWSS